MEILEILKNLSENNYLGLVVVFMIISQYFIIKNNTKNFNLLLNTIMENKKIQKDMLNKLKEIKNEINEIKDELKEKKF
jgi:hypothetical protein